MVGAESSLVQAEEQPMPSAVVSPSLPTVGKNNEYDSHFFQQILRDAGRWAFGVIFVEVWVLNEARTHIFRPEYGWWIDEVAIDFGANSKFDRLTDPNHPEYLEPAPLAPGVGLPGCLWSESKVENAAVSRRSMRFSRLSVGAASAAYEQNTFETNKNLQRRGRGILATSKVTWRQVKPLSDDPDQPYNPRLHYLGEIGLGWAAGVSFQVGSTEGIVIYMARDTTDEKKLRSVANEEYLTHSSLLVGSAYAMRAPRLVVEEERKIERINAIRKLKTKVRQVIQAKKTLENVVKEESGTTSPTQLGADSLAHMTPGSPPKSPCYDGFQYILRKTRLCFTKFFGAANKPPAAFTWDQTALTFAGAFLTLSALTTLNTALARNFGKSHTIVLGPFGALMTLQYGLTAAPASQPRNIIFGQLIGILIAHGVGRSVNLEPWLKQTIATSLAISCMVKVGVTHPPAGAAALLFSDGTKTWQQIVMMFLGNVIAIILAAIINNFSERRQYPTFWGFQPMYDLFEKDEDDIKKDNKKAA